MMRGLEIAPYAKPPMNRAIPRSPQRPAQPTQKIKMRTAAWQAYRLALTKPYNRKTKVNGILRPSISGHFTFTFQTDSLARKFLLVRFHPV